MLDDKEFAIPKSIINKVKVRLFLMNLIQKYEKKNDEAEDQDVDTDTDNLKANKATLKKEVKSAIEEF